MDIKRTWHLTNTAGNHIVEVCHNDISQAEAVSRFLIEGLRKSEAVVIFAKPSLRKAVIDRMSACGLDVQAIKNEGQIKFFDAEFLISSMRADSILEEQAFEEYVSTQIEAAQLKYGKVRVFGGMVATLWSTGEYDAAMQLEDFWMNLTQKLEFSLLCCYSLSNQTPRTYERALQFICRCHNHLVPVESNDLPETNESEEWIDILGDAWNHVIEKMAESGKSSEQSPSLPILN